MKRSFKIDDVNIIKHCHFLYHGGTDGSVAEVNQNRALGDLSIRLERAARRCKAQV